MQAQKEAEICTHFQVIRTHQVYNPTTYNPDIQTDTHLSQKLTIRIYNILTFSAKVCALSSPNSLLLALRLALVTR